MFEIECPFCGKRDQSEFSYGGEAHISRPANGHDLSDGEWAQWVFMRSNTMGLCAERWIHTAGCRRFFNVLRNTATDQILAVYKTGETAPSVTVAQLATPCGEAIGSGNDAVKVMSANDASQEGDK